ncbi:hypothetical protein AB4407_02040 [Vibrio sp. 10N.261.46.E11]|uniref:hypothetical protein n=1 Tax=Vibrio sp. 10N.261.46.E11 TaxID=3229662 RepID=UPI00354F58FE
MFDPWYPLGTANMLQVPVQYSIRHGKIIAETQPAKTKINLDKTEEINFKR